MAEDALERAAYEADPTLFWLWPERWLETPINKASQKFEAFWRFIPRVADWIRVKGGPGSIGEQLGFHGAPGEVVLRQRSKELAHTPSASCDQKSTFPSFASARAAAPDLTPYRCTRCEGVHVTMQPRESWSGRNINGRWDLIYGGPNG